MSDSSSQHHSLSPVTESVPEQAVAIARMTGLVVVTLLFGMAWSQAKPDPQLLAQRAMIQPNFSGKPIPVMLVEHHQQPAHVATIARTETHPSSQYQPCTTRMSFWMKGTSPMAHKSQLCGVTSPWNPMNWLHTLPSCRWESKRAATELSTARAEPVGSSSTAQWSSQTRNSATALHRPIMTIRLFASSR
ncbi:MAG: hypothetical protein H6824_09160 [Planctomycetaceae bacterium]|nr:hypothetical protein [Planctomycetaceae bacterium]